MTMPMFHLLLKEGSLIRGCLRSALFAFRKTRGSEPDQFYVTSFAFAIGLERLLKVLLLLHHWQHDKRLLNDDDLRRYGHDIDKLFEAVRPLFAHYNVQWPDGFDWDTIDFRLLSFMSSFGKTTRYFNLNALVGAQRGSDPIAEWSDVLEQIYKTDVPEMRRIHNEDQCDGLVEMIEPNVVRMPSATSMRGLPQTFRDKVQEDFSIALARPHAFWRLVKLIVPLKELAIVIQHRIQQDPLRREEPESVPYFEELLDVICMDRDTMLEVYDDHAESDEA